MHSVKSAGMRSATKSVTSGSKRLDVGLVLLHQAAATSSFVEHFRVAGHAEVRHARRTQVQHAGVIQCGAVAQREEHNDLVLPEIGDPASPTTAYPSLITWDAGARQAVSPTKPTREGSPSAPTMRIWMPDCSDQTGGPADAAFGEQFVQRLEQTIMDALADRRAVTRRGRRGDCFPVQSSPVVAVPTRALGAAA